MTAQPVPYLTAAEYLAIERSSDVKHEYFRGEMFAMAGASRTHNRISLNTASFLDGRLSERGCETFMADMRVQVEPTGLYTYPDVVVTCEEPRFADEREDTLLNPQLLVEVLSPSTEGYDRGKKFDHYRQIESLKEYLLVSQEEHLVIRYSRDDHGRWFLVDARGLDAKLTLESVGAELPLAEVYARVELSSGDREADGDSEPR